jgi:conjugative transfer signal peptidase TraF
MATGRSDKLKPLRRAVLIALSVLAAAFAIGRMFGLRINTSTSLPVGLYRAVADKDARLVEFCPAEPFAALAAVRGYRERGACPDRAAPLLKPVVAEIGDIVDFSVRGISVNGTLLPNTAPLATDTKGRALRAWTFGHYVVAPGTVWVASTYQARSFDSRYFGPVSLADVRARLTPVLVR